jgi:hypothetical protein
VATEVTRPPVLVVLLIRLVRRESKLTAVEPVVACPNVVIHQLVLMRDKGVFPDIKLVRDEGSELPLLRRLQRLEILQT